MVELLSIRWEHARNKYLHERQAEGLLDSQTLTSWHRVLALPIYQTSSTKTMQHLQYVQQ